MVAAMKRDMAIDLNLSVAVETDDGFIGLAPIEAGDPPLPYPHPHPPPRGMTLNVPERRVDPSELPASIKNILKGDI